MFGVGSAVVLIRLPAGCGYRGHHEGMLQRSSSRNCVPWLRWILHIDFRNASNRVGVCKSVAGQPL